MNPNKISQKIVVYKDNESVIVTQKTPTKKERFFEFWIEVGVKIVRTFMSVKVWGLIAIPWICTELLVRGYLTGDNWAMVVATTVSVIYGMREIFKISHIGNSDYDVYDMMAIGGGSISSHDNSHGHNNLHNRRKNDKIESDTEEEDDDLYGGKEEFNNYEPPKFG